MDLSELMEQIKEEGTLVRPPIRVRKIKKGKQFKGLKTGKKAEFTPEQYAKKVERDKTTWAGLSGKWKHLRKTYRSRKVAWTISLDEWVKLWETAGTVKVGDLTMTVWSRRGKRKGDAKVWRIDPTGNWELSNMVVVYRGEVVANGRKLAAAELAKKA